MQQHPMHLGGRRCALPPNPPPAFLFLRMTPLTATPLPRTARRNKKQKKRKHMELQGKRGQRWRKRQNSQENLAKWKENTKKRKENTWETQKTKKNPKKNKTKSKINLAPILICWSLRPLCPSPWEAVTTEKPPPTTSVHLGLIVKIVGGSWKPQWFLGVGFLFASPETNSQFCTWKIGPGLF